MPEKTDAQKKAQKKYMEKFMVAQVRMEREKYGRIQAHAAVQGESVNSFINRAIDQTMAQEAVGSPTRPADATGVSLHSKVGECAPMASQGHAEGIIPPNERRPNE